MQKEDRVVDFSEGSIVKVNTKDLICFQQYAQTNTKKKQYRLCLHNSPESELNEMFICRCREDYSRPERHPNVETHIIIEGREAVVLFSEDGEIEDVFLLDKSGGYLAYRINERLYHFTLVLSEKAIDYEVKAGPFIKENTEYPQWAPNGRDEYENEQFINTIRKKIESKINPKAGVIL